jgi:hypothetical protein
MIEVVDLERVTVLQDGNRSMSWHYPEPGVAEIVHVQGKWARDAEAFAAAFGEELRKRRIWRLTWSGRTGWPRFLAEASTSEREW